jgi:hypothetical protein
MNRNRKSLGGGAFHRKQRRTPPDRQRCEFSGAYKSQTRQVTRQKPSATRQELVGQQAQGNGNRVISKVIKGVSNWKTARG